MSLSPEERERARAAVGRAAAALVEDGMRVGLGTGDSASFAVRALAERARDGLRVVSVATSERTAELARSLGLSLVELDDVPLLDLTIDGADEVAPDLRLIKGAGGALLREKIVAQSSRRMVVVADDDKRVTRLGERTRLPIEIVRFGARHTLDRIAALGLEPILRASGAVPYVTDGGDFIADARLPDGVDPAQIEAALERTTGVVETGLFLREASEALVGDRTGNVARLLRPARS